MSDDSKKLTNAQAYMRLLGKFRDLSGLPAVSALIGFMEKQSADDPEFSRGANEISAVMMIAGLICACDETAKASFIERDIPKLESAVNGIMDAANLQRKTASGWKKV